LSNCRRISDEALLIDEADTVVVGNNGGGGREVGCFCAKIDGSGWERIGEGGGEVYKIIIQNSFILFRKSLCMKKRMSSYRLSMGHS
jgi:hypothetical protein